MSRITCQNRQIPVIFFWPCVRKPHERLARQVLLSKPTGKRPRRAPNTRWSDCISELAWSGPVLVWIQQNDQRLLLTVRYCKFPYSCCPLTLPRGKLGMKVNQTNSIYVV